MFKIELPEIFQNGMMFQREKPVKIWGKVSENRKLRICFCNQSLMVTASEEGFYCEFPKQDASTGQMLSIYIEGEENPEIELSDISIGDIFIAAGQSNMEFFLRYDAHWNDVKKWKKNKNIHMFNCRRIAYSGQVRNTPDSGIWFQEHDIPWETFSAAGYSFARTLQPVLNVPIGIIGCNWGGTPACAWMEDSCFETEPLKVFKEEYEEAISGFSDGELRELSMKAWEFEDSYMHQVAWRAMMYGMNEQDQKEWKKENADFPSVPLGPYHHYRPSGLYGEMLKKLAPFPVKGVLWYQGESDAGHAAIYHKTFSSLIQCWRRLWQDELPFLFVQLAPFGRWLDIEGTEYPKVRECQERVSKEVPNTGMISIMDLGMYEDIHPKQKMEVGERLALLARGKLYGEKLLCESPEFVKGERQGKCILLEFNNTGESLFLEGEKIKSLVINQEGSTKKIKSFEIGKRLILEIEELDESPVEIFFGMEGYCEVNLFNEARLPVKPFHAFWDK